MPSLVENIGVFSHRLEDERERIKRLQIEQSLPPLSPTTIPKEKAFALGDSIEVSSAERTPKFRPELPSSDPYIILKRRSHPLVKIIQCLIKADARTELFLDVLEKELDRTQMRLDELSEELKIALAEEMETKIWEGNWHTFETVLQYFTAAASIVLGGALVLTEADQSAGACLIAAGGLGFVNQIMTDTKGWSLLADYFTESQEMKKTLEGKMQMTMFLLSTALAFSGTALAIDNGTMPETDLFKIISVAGSLLRAGNKLAAGTIRSRSCGIQAQIISNNGEATYLRKHLETLSLEGKETQEKIQHMVSIVKEAIQQMSRS